MSSPISEETFIGKFAGQVIGYTGIDPYKALSDFTELNHKLEFTSIYKPLN